MLTVTSVAADILAMPFIGWSVGWQEILVIVVIVLILFGGRKIPELARGIGRGMREFKREIRGVREDFEEAVNEEEDEEPKPRKKKRRKKKPAEDEDEHLAESGEQAEEGPADAEAEKA